MLKKEIYYFFTALMFFTRIPVPEIKDFNADYMNKSRKYLPVIGLIIGGISAVALWLFSLIFPLSIALILSMIFSIIITGAFHEDGLGDTFDAFGGGQNKEKILSIMKDSRLGTYGTVSIIVVLLLKYLTLFEIAKNNIHIAILSLIVIHGLSRYMALIIIKSQSYVQDSARSKSKDLASSKLKNQDMIFASIFIAPLFLLFPSWQYSLIIPISIGVTILMGFYFKKKIGGYTGDCLGALQQITEVISYLAVILLWKFI